jgi:hypothetical protein
MAAHALRLDAARRCSNLNGLRSALVTSCCRCAFFAEIRCECSQDSFDLQEEVSVGDAETRTSSLTKLSRSVVLHLRTRNPHPA